MIKSVETLRTKFDFFIDYQVKVHIKKKDKTFLNGFILKWIKNDVYLIREDKFGEMPIFLHDVYDIEQHRGESGDGNTE